MVYKWKTIGITINMQKSGFSNKFILKAERCLQKSEMESWHLKQGFDMKMLAAKPEGNSTSLTFLGDICKEETLRCSKVCQRNRKGRP